MRNPKLRRTAPQQAAELAAAKITPEADDRTDGAVPARPPGFAAYLRYFLGLGTWGFGGPIASVGYMQRDLVERRGWLGEAEFLDGVALGQTMPGPLAAQVVMWVGFLRKGWAGALATAAAFIAPSFLLVLAVAVIYARYSGLAVVQSLFYGIAPAVMAIIAIAAWKLARLANRRDTRLWVISAVLALVTAVSGAETPVPFIPAALLMIPPPAPPPPPTPCAGGPPAAAAGAIAGAVIVLSRQTITDIPTAAIAALSLGLLLWRKIPEPVFVALGAIAGILFH